ncbi:MAG: MerR family transcriptional regulator [Alistipes sp.]|nr:MerR family transcriptional regulator [Alistipes sp.]
MAEKIYYSMGEVAEMFDVNQSLIRHWESKFDCLRPHKNKRGNRMFTPEDIEKLKQIYHLVKERGMTLEGARKVMRGASGKELARETELLERLQRIRSALVEVREELKGDDENSVVVSVETELQDLEREVKAATKPAKPAAKAVAKPKNEEVAPTEVATPAEEESTPAEVVAPAEEVVVAESESGSETPQESPAEPSVEQPVKKRTRRRRKSDDDNKELFPFYEQSLF